jgi:type VI secretion system protein ImpL
VKIVKALIGFLTNKWVVQFLGLLALALLIGFAGPLIAVAGKTPLESEMARAVTIAAMFLAWLIYRLLMLILAGRKDRQLMSELAATEPGKSAEMEASEEEVETLKQGFEEALNVLRESRAQAKGGKQCLYELPWYVIIGAPGSGKTTALVNSGLKFPLAERLGKNFVKGVSGTRNCDWWFTDEAVLLDTAGRYTTQDSHQAVDAAAWQGFLQLVKKNRPRRPLNGVLVTLSLADLLQQTEEERNQHGAAVRRRVQELYQLLGVRLPVYLLITKTDLIAGFTDFFADFSQEDREQVWGETFPVDDPAHPRDWLQQFDSTYDELLQRIDKRKLQRIQEERDIQRRSLILDFPQQMALLKPLMASFLLKAFAPNRFEQPFLLRGIYFTSGTQEGTPIDRVMGILAGAFKLDRQSSPMYSGRGKSFFLTRLLKEVIFPEAELAGSDQRVERRHQLLQIGALAAAFCLTLAVIGLWAISYGINKAAIAKTEEQLTLYRTADVAPFDAQSNFKQLLPKLEAQLAVKGIWDSTGIMSHLGLNQGGKLGAGADDAYEGLLRGYFLPSIVSRLRDRIQAKPDVLLLKTYLMLGQPEKLDPKVVEAVVRADWELTFTSEPETIAKLTTHLQNLLQLNLGATQLDQNLIAAVRAKLTQSAPEQQCYESFKTEMGGATDHSHDFRLAEALKPNGPKAFFISDVKDKGFGFIPALFTAWGYGELFLRNSLVFVKGCMEQNWVLGIPETSSDPLEITRLHEKLKLLYLRDYQEYWSGMLAGIKLLPAQNMTQTINLLDVLSRPDSPLRMLLLALEKNTSLTKASSLLAQVAGKALPAQDAQALKLQEAAMKAVGSDAGLSVDPVRRMENVFESLNALVRAEPDKPAQIDAVLNKAKELRDYFMQTGGDSQAHKGAGMGGDVAGAARMEFARLPEPVKTWLMSLTNSGVTLGQLETAKAVEKAKKEEVEKKKEEAAKKLKEANKKLKELGIAAAGIGGGVDASGGGQGGGSQCKTAFGGRYPFVRSSQLDAPLADFSKFFSPNGIMDQFFQANLKDSVDTSSPQWRQKPADGLTPALSQAAIHEFQLAAKIRDAFFPVGGQTPMVQFDLKPLELDANADSFHLNIEGQEIIYRHGAEQVTRIQWPGQAAGSGARIVFEKPDKSQVVLSKEGPWAMFRLFDKSALVSAGGQDQFNLTFQAEGLSARFELRTVSVNNPFSLGDSWDFRCPESL